MKSSEFVNNVRVPSFGLATDTPSGGRSGITVAASHNSVDAISTYSVVEDPLGKRRKSNGKGGGNPPPPFYGKIGDLIHYAIGDRLNGTRLAQSFLSHSEVMGELQSDLTNLERYKQERWPLFDDIPLASEYIADEIARFLSVRDEGREVTHFFEASFSPNVRAFKPAAVRVNEGISAGELPVSTSFEASLPYVRGVGNGLDTSGLSEDQVADLRKVGSASTIYVHTETGEASAAADNIRPDYLRISYHKTDRNEDMEDILAVLKKIKTGDSKRANILDFGKWVDEEVTYMGQTKKASQVMEIFVDKILAGDVRVTVNEVKTHLNGKSRIYTPVDNQFNNIPVVRMDTLDPDLAKDVAATTSALFRFAGQFRPELFEDIDIARKFFQSCRVNIIEVNLNMIRHDTLDLAHARPEDLQPLRPAIRYCQLHYLDMEEAWEERHSAIFDNRKEPNNSHLS